MTGKSKIVVLLLALLAPAVGYTLYWVLPTVSNEGYEPEQPIPYSHKLHAGKHKMNCLYCHSNAEKSQHATIPSLNICMNCHRVVKTDSPYIQRMKELYEKGEPIEWVRVHELPDHAHFTHQPHVTAGIACQTCHGPIQEMERVYQFAPLNMGWCMDCHRGKTTPNNVKTRLPVSEQNPHGTQVAPTNCVTCHY